MRDHSKTNIRIIRAPEGDKREKGEESLFKEIIAGNIPNLRKDMHLEVHRALFSQCFQTLSNAHYN